MYNAYSYGRVCNGQGEGRGNRLVKGKFVKTHSKLKLLTHLIVITTNDVHVSRDGPQIVICFTVANISSAKNLLDFSWNEKFLELGWEVMDSMRDMKIANDEDEDHGWLLGGVDEAQKSRSDKAALGNRKGTLATSALSHLNLLMAHSLEERCTPLKLEYDSCFNSWFEGYLEPAVSASASPENRAEYSRAKAEEYERKCGKIWASYRDCVQVCRVFDIFLTLTLNG